MNASKYTESILNAIASGFQTINDICAAINANYASVQRVINNLVKEKKVIRHDVTLASARGEKYKFSLSISERWRLYSYSYTFLIIDISNTFNVDTHNISPIFSVDHFDMYDLDFDILSKKSVYVQIGTKWNHLADAIEKKCEFRLLLPLLIITNTMEITSELLKLIRNFSEFLLPILYLNDTDAEWILEPIECSIEKINDPTIELIYTEIKKRQPLIDTLYMSIENLRSMIEHPKDSDDIIKIKRDLKDAIEKYNNESISVKMLSNKLGISSNTISKYLQILLSANRVKRDASIFNAHWYLNKREKLN